MKKITLQKGQQFQWWTVTGGFVAGKWKCRCRCGTVRAIKSNALLSGKSGSCGCWAKIAMRKIGAAQLQRNIPGYRVWRGMVDRCHNNKNLKFGLYGGRGITVCARWLESFWNFYEDMGARPSSAHSIDRIDTNGPYSPGNCRWADVITQNCNKRTNRFITINRERKVAAEWWRLSGVPRATFWARVRAGILDERLLVKSLRRSALAVAIAIDLK